MTDTESSNGRMAEFLKEHPRMMGVLFSLTVLLTQAAPVLADGSHNGP